jgi:hypothetical protein
MSVNQTQHRHIDTNLQVTLACPAAGAAGTTASIDTRSGANALAIAGPGQTASWTGNAALERMELEVLLPATTTLVDGKIITISFTDSADNSSFAAVYNLPSLVNLVGITGNGSAEYRARVKLPSDIRRYVKATFTVPADAGTNTAYTFTVSLLT